MSGFPDPSSPSVLDGFLMGEHVQLTHGVENSCRQIYAGLPKSDQVLISTLGGVFQRGFYRQILIKALEALNLTNLLDAVQQGETLTVNMLTEPGYRPALGLAESDRRISYLQLYREMGKALVAFKSRLGEDPEVAAALGVSSDRFWEDHDCSRASRAPADEKFRRLVAAWRESRGPTSSLTEMAMRPEYQQIIGMGRDALPLLLDELRKEPDHWFWALVAITGEDPVSPEHKGQLSEMTRAWLQWGKEHGYPDSNGT